MLCNCRIRHGKGRKKKAHGDTGYRPKGNPDFSQSRVNKAINDRYKDDDCQSVDVQHNIVGYPVKLHSTSFKKLEVSSAGEMRGRLYLGIQGCLTFDYIRANIWGKI